jgi:exopolyphosphatase / guanosine-5'-triphosphate,3'-diphosphate pyrophosphatase
MTRVAAIDCGTNTIKLLVADLSAADGTEIALEREMRIVRLGQDVDRTGRLADEALARTFAAVEEYAALIAHHDVQRIRFCATSASRDASNSAEFMAGVRERLGVDAEVVSGEEEAQLSYDGATRSLPDVPGPVLVVDIGGGSTELILGDPGPGGARDAAPRPGGARDGERGHVTAAKSLDIGSVRITERLMRSDPPTTQEIGAAVRAIDEALDTLPSYGVEAARAGTVVGVAGTVTTLAAVLLGLTSWDRSKVHHAPLDVADLHELTQRLLTMTAAERQTLGIPEGRADVIGAGALILERVLLRSEVSTLLVSDSDILDGIAWSVA